MLNCRKIGPEYAVVYTDYAAQCDTAKWHFHAIVAVCVIVLFGVGVPLSSVLGSTRKRDNHKRICFSRRHCSCPMAGAKYSCSYFSRELRTLIQAGHAGMNATRATHFAGILATMTRLDERLRSSCTTCGAHHTTASDASRHSRAKERYYIARCAAVAVNRLRSTLTYR